MKIPSSAGHLDNQISVKSVKPVKVPILSSWKWRLTLNEAAGT